MNMSQFQNNSPTTVSIYNFKFNYRKVNETSSESEDLKSSIAEFNIYQNDENNQSIVTLKYLDEPFTIQIPLLKQKKYPNSSYQCVV